MIQPVIGLNCDIKRRSKRKVETLEVYRDYARSVELAGAVPVCLPVVDDPVRLDRQLDLIDGLVLTGGNDYDPTLYGARRHPETTLLHPDRQAYDLELARAAIRRKIPTLAICGGLQLVNIVCGGDLVQHVPDLGGKVVHSGATHEVTTEPDTRLARILKREHLEVNSTHHQVVGRVGGGLRVSARSADGVVEGLESKGEAFLVCVQWHPERLAAGRPEHLALFGALVEAALGEPEVA